VTLDGTPEMLSVTELFALAFKVIVAELLDLLFTLRLAGAEIVKSPGGLTVSDRDVV